MSLLLFLVMQFGCVSSVRMMFKLSEIVCTLCIDRVFVLVYDVVSCCFLGVGALPSC
ncbi:hypothetical protein HanPI659440_Chr01g0023701 [Helianthus annuus]|nr:hypothetical protein HanPI659440_Chr01g0023701 [Helianthus annuus]